MTTGAEGIAFPRTDAGGGRSTSATGRAVLAAAARAVDADLADAIAGERDWRRAYPAHLRALEAAGARDPAAGVRIAREGLDALHSRFVAVRDGEEVPLAEAFRRHDEGGFGTATVRGAGTRPRELTLPYAGQLLRGDALRRQLAAWVRAGTVEPSCAEAVGRVLEHPEWLDLGDLTFALLGAGAETGPLPALCAWGADVLAVDLPASTTSGEEAWAGILDTARGGSGRLRSPVRGGPEGRHGADLLTEGPQVRAWLRDVAPDGQRLVVGSYGYADGGAFVRLALAGDAVTAALLADGRRVVPAYLATPTDAFAVPEPVVAAARARFAAAPPWQQRLSRLSVGRLLGPGYASTVPTTDGREMGIADSLVLQQGPNYALAKRLQRWRAVVAQADGRPVSANVAPPTRTRSVLRNRLLAAAYRGAGRFGVEVFEPATSSWLMAALLVHDLRTGAARPDPRDLLVDGAAHGGLWRSGYEPRSALGLAVLAGLARR